MNFDFLVKVLGTLNLVLPLVGVGIKAVIHLAGSDTHKTVAGDVADKLKEAGDAAGALRDQLLNGVQHGSQADPPT